MRVNSLKMLLDLWVNQKMKKNNQVMLLDLWVKRKNQFSNLKVIMTFQKYQIQKMSKQNKKMIIRF